MHCFLGKTIAALGILAIAETAVAADLGPVYKGAAPVVAAYNWSGFYAGIQGGYGKLSGTDIDGGFFGGTIGVNWQAPGSAFVFGVEGDMAWAGLSDSASDTILGFPVTAETELNWFGTARVRAGIAADRALFYVTGGAAWAHNELSLSIGGIGSGSASNTHTGWTVGGGVEWALVDNWTAKVEYLFLDLDSKDYVLTIAGTAMPGVEVNGEAHTIKLGLNYRFGGGKAPVVANY